MQFKDQLDFVWQHIRKNKLRVFMTVLAATMGTAFLIVLASVGFGIHDTIRSSILSNRIVTEIQVYSGDLKQEDIAEMKNIKHVNAVIYRQQVNAEERTFLDDYTGHQYLIITDIKEEEKAGFALAEGRLPEKEGEVVVGGHFAQFFAKEHAEGSEEEPESYKGNVLGEKFTYALGNRDGEEASHDSLELTIVGIAEKPAKEWAQDYAIYTDTSIIPSIQLLAEDVLPEDTELLYGQVAVHANDLENVKMVSETLKDQGYSVYSVADEIGQLDVFFLALKAGLVFVGTIAILIASIGIFNTMTMAVTERTREIGVMKAIGASPKLIQRLFLMESVWIGVIGTVIAVIISYAVSYIANLVLPVIVSAALQEEDFQQLDVTFSIIPWQLVLIASIISIAVAMISGWRPARKATKIDVIQALRQEL